MNVPAGAVPVSPVSPPPTAVRALFRESTHAAHLRLDQFVAGHLLQPHISASVYVNLLTGLRAFFAAWEPSVEAALPGHLSDVARSRSKIPFLDADLQSLGAAQCVATHDGNGTAIAMPSLATAHAALGSMYVVEGSTLGGVFIVRRWREIFAGRPMALCTRYFESYGAAVPARWKEFVALLERHVPAEGVAEAAAAAAATFSAVERVFAVALDSGGE